MLGFCEGLLKPQIAADRLGFPVVGASGGNFGSSPEQVKAALASGLTPVLLPDGGAIANPNVMRQYRALAELAPGLQVLWWGQATKADGDIDEISDTAIAAAKLISFAEFDAMAVEIGAVDGGDRALEHYKAQTEAIIGQLSQLDIEPTLQLSGSYIPRNTHHWLPTDSKILAIDAPMGVGKTSTYLKELVAQHREQFPDSIQYLLTPTNALGQQSAQKLDLPHHTKLKGYGIPQRATLCPPSGWRFPIARLPGDRPLVMIDEPSALLEQIADGKTCGDKHALILQWLRQLFRWVKKQQGWIVLSEDGLSNCEIDLIKEASGIEAIDLITFERDRLSERDYTVFERRSMLDCTLKNRLSGGENLVLASDSKKWLETARDKAIALGIPKDDIWILTGDNSSDEWAIAFTENPDRWIAENKPRILGFSPACVSGISIDDPEGHFNALGFCLTHLAPEQAKQMPERLRTDVPRFGYIKEHGAVLDATFSSARPEVIIKDFYRNKAGVERLIKFAEYALKKAPTDVEGNPIDLVGAIAKIKASQTDPDSDFGFWLRWWANYQAKANYTRSSLRASLIKLWESRGHSIHLIQGNSPAENQESTALRQKRERDEAIAIANRNTEGLSLSDAREILEGSQATSEDQKRAQKRILEDKLPTCNLSDPDFVYKAIIKDGGQFLRATELLWMARNPKAAQWLDRWRWASEAKTAVQRGTFVSYARLSFHSGKATLLNECPLTPFIDGKVEQWDNKTPEAIAVHQWAMLHRHEFRRFLRLKICADHPPVKTVNKLLRVLSLIIESVGWKGSRMDRERQYRCTNLVDADRSQILESLEARLNQQLEAKEGNDSPPQTNLVIATRLDTNPPTSCDHGSPLPLAKVPLEFHQTFLDMWRGAQSARERAVILHDIQTLWPDVWIIAS